MEGSPNGLPVQGHELFVLSRLARKDVRKESRLDVHVQARHGRSVQFAPRLHLVVVPSRTMAPLHRRRLTFSRVVLGENVRDQPAVAADGLGNLGDDPDVAFGANPVFFRRGFNTYF